MKMTAPSRKKAVLFQSPTASREAPREAARLLRGSVMQARSGALFLQHGPVFFTGAPPPRFQELPFTQEKIVTLASGAFGAKTTG
jgi:hypothetical protein